jgi:hypothetical protein
VEKIDFGLEHPLRWGVLSRFLDAKLVFNALQQPQSRMSFCRQCKKGQRERENYRTAPLKSFALLHWRQPKRKTFTLNHFFAALIFAHLAFAAAEIFFLAAALIFRLPLAGCAFDTMKGSVQTICNFQDEPESPKK